jgi:hypothetical protein
MIPLDGSLRDWTPQQFEACFFEWAQSITETVRGVIAIDGKTLRRSHDHAAGKKALHLVSAWAAEHRLVLAPVAGSRNPIWFPVISVNQRPVGLATPVGLGPAVMP